MTFIVKNNYVLWRTVRSLVARASDSGPEDAHRRCQEDHRCPMPPNTLRVHTEYVLVKSVEIVEVEIEVVSPSIVPLGEFCRAKLYCYLYGAQGQRQAYHLPHATMNFVDLDLTTSDRWH
ncbi:hypothetical protein TNCV_2443231 [Trichonephila clavipes]|nr:hypothetical protein TNCV_2443231 [Trichonephila clavipes]